MSFVERVAEFSVIATLGKFDDEKIILSDGNSASEWFDENKENILNGNSPFSARIKDQYKNFKYIDSNLKKDITRVI